MSAVPKSAVNRSGRAPGQKYIIFPDPLGCRAWYVGADGQMERGPSGHREPALRNKMTRWGMIEVTLADVPIEDDPEMPWPMPTLDLITGMGDV